MKKILSLFLAALLIFSAYSMNAYAQEPTKTDQWFAKENAFEFSADVTVYHDYYEDYSFKLYLKNNKFCAKNYSIIENIKIDLIYDNSTVYMYLSAFPFVYWEFNDDALIEDGFKLNELVPLSGCYEQKINSTTYYIEEFKYEESEISKFCFADDKLEMIISEYGNSQIYYDITYEQIDDSVFEPPFFSINITPLFNFFEQLFF